LLHGIKKHEKLHRYKRATVLPDQFNHGPCVQFPIFDDNFRHFKTTSLATRRICRTAKSSSCTN